MPQQPKAPDQEGKQPECIARSIGVGLSPERRLQVMEAAAKGRVQVPAHFWVVDPNIEEQSSAHNLKCWPLFAYVHIALTIREAEVIS
eukprot:scaffold172958_cov36-Tisochrysis_lutea.AAC.3